MPPASSMLANLNFQSPGPSRILRRLMNREVLDRWCERGILGLALAMLVLLPLAFGGRPQRPVGAVFDFLLLDPFLLAQGLMLPLLALWLLRLWADPKPRLLWPPMAWAVLAFTGYAIGRYFTADIEYVARRELVRILVYALLFFVVLNNLHRQETTRSISLTLVVLAMLISFYAMYQFLAKSDRVWHVLKTYPMRGSGTYICPNHLGGFLELVLPLGLTYTLMGRLKPVGKILLGYASLVVLAGIVVTLSRGAWVSTACALLLLFGVMLFHRTYRLPAAVLLALILGAGFFFIPKSTPLHERAKLLSTDGKLDDDLRFALWRPALQLWQDHLWFGVGPDHFDDRFRAYRPETVQARPDRVHNDYINTLVDWGLAGAGLVAAACLLLAAGVWKTWRAVRRAPADIGGKSSSSKFAFVLGASLGLVAILVHSLVDFNMHIPANALVAVTLMALLSSHLRFATDNFWATAGPVTKSALSLVVLSAVVFLGADGLRQARQNAWLAKAALVHPLAPAKVTLLKQAFGVEPKNPNTAFEVGEALRLESSEGPTNYVALAGEAMTWFGRALELNPWHCNSLLRYGWCLDWTNRAAESAAYFERAERLDPNNHFTLDQIGMHYVQIGNYAAAKPWFERSLRLHSPLNQTATQYLEIVNRRLLESAAR